ncbi:triose-phosphate isomerase [Crocinitomix algicola]|uniref:triose-phosphate isomerase n=1 Tax=Crocinitomix algicola TaxID=1740263 RepID=UPI00082ACA80|nr:triose-phosphate isomerase [Crocinitomix algicola]
MTRKIVAGNWKMNLDYDEAKLLLKNLIASKDQFPSDVEVVICPSAPYISAFAEVLRDQDWISLGSQNNYFIDEGAFTGEISPKQLKSLGVKFGIVGHSERRDNFDEDYSMLSKKVKALLKHNVRPIFCCGEQLQVRDSNVYKEFVMKQIQDSLFKLKPEELAQLVIAYEPIWAIGTGKTATADQAQEIHHLIRSRIASEYNDKIANQVGIIYGGSCNADNAKELFSQKDIDGGLIGGASLKTESFTAIANSF